MRRNAFEPNESMLLVSFASKTSSVAIGLNATIHNRPELNCQNLRLVA